MTSPNPITALSGPPQSCDNLGLCAPTARRLNRPKFLNSFTFSLIGLAIAVALWGYGYKLSLYHRHPGTSSVNQVAKLWTKERGGAASGLHSGAPAGHGQDTSAQPAPQHPGALTVLLAANEGFERPPYQSSIEFDLLSRPPPSTACL
ncbi:MAG: hypothetical protein WAL75_16825 [Terracidiphilus sp.]